MGLRMTNVNNNIEILKVQARLIKLQLREQ